MLKLDLASESVLEPTATEDEMQAGAAMPEHEESLPAAMTVAMPAARRLSTAAFLELASQGEAKSELPPTREELMGFSNPGVEDGDIPARAGVAPAPGGCRPNQIRRCIQLRLIRLSDVGLGRVIGGFDQPDRHVLFDAQHRR